MSNKNYSLLTGGFFMIVGILHLSRLLLGWEAMIGGWLVPMWVSVVAVVVTGCLAYQGFKNSK